MKQAELDLNLNAHKTHRQVVLDQMDNVPWDDLVDLIAPHHAKGKVRRFSPFALQSMLHTHLMQQWFSLGDQAMEVAFMGTPLHGDFTQAPCLWATVRRIHRPAFS